MKILDSNFCQIIRQTKSGSQMQIAHMISGIRGLGRTQLC